MNNIEKIIDMKRKIGRIVEDTEGMEIRYKGFYGTIMYIDLNDTATIYLENSEGHGWEETISLKDLAELI